MSQSSVSQSQFLLPDVGEGLTEAEIVAWKVAPGDRVSINQVLVEIETAKSLVELPSPFEGTIGQLLVKEGEVVPVGAPIVQMESSDSPSVPAHADSGIYAGGDGPQEVAQASKVTQASESTDDKSGAVLVGYGNGGRVASRRAGRSKGAVAARGDRDGRQRGEAAASSSPAPVEPVDAPPIVAPDPVPNVSAEVASFVLAKPPIRRLAKELGVDLNSLRATGRHGEITRDDVLREAEQASVFRNVETPEWPEKREERIPVKGVRKAIAQAMVSSAYSAPHVSLFVDVDASRTMEFVKRLKLSTEFAGIRISPLLIMAKAIIWAVQRNATVNSSWTDKEIIVHHFVNLGVAAATPRGLMVPNVKDAQAMSLRELAEALEQLTIAARDGKTPPADMKGGTITVTNIGVFGMDTGTPILNPGEAAIVALGGIKQKPWVVDGVVQPRFVTTIGASFDHRVVDGDVASRFVADVAAIMEEPALLLE